MFNTDTVIPEINQVSSEQNLHPMAPNGSGSTILLSNNAESFPTTTPTAVRQGPARGPTDAPAQLPSSNTNIPSRPVDYKREAERLRTYENWPVAFLERKLMAEAGFFFTRKLDLVKCAFCGIEIGKWEEGDDPIRDHLRWKPHCPFMKKMNVGNVPISQESATPPASEALERNSYDTCGPYGIEVRPFSGPENELRQPSLEHLGVNKATAPIHKGFITCETRIKSFENWPVSMKQKPDVLSDAGFFYTGKGDQTICFHCGGGLKDWVETDDPWEEHATWFPKCNFVLLRKGKEFVDLQTNKANLTTKETLEIESTAEVATVPELSPMDVGGRSDNDARLCKICCVEDLGVVFLPCGHLVACVKCAPSISACPVCRKPLTATVRAYLP